MFKPDDSIVCSRPHDYSFTMGKTYTVVEYSPKWHDNETPGGFTWPAYVTVIDDEGKRATCHADRFVIAE